MSDILQPQGISQPTEIFVDAAGAQRRVVICTMPPGPQFTILRLDKKSEPWGFTEDGEPLVQSIGLPSETKPVREWVPPMPRPPQLDGVEVETGLHLPTGEVPAYVKSAVIVVDGARVEVQTPEDVKAKVRVLLPPPGPDGQTPPEANQILQQFVQAFIRQFAPLLLRTAVLQRAREVGRLVRCAGPYERGEFYLDKAVTERDVIRIVEDLIALDIHERKMQE